MKQVFIVKEGNPNLIVFFAGWGADETPFKEYRPKEDDYMICYDYRNLDFDFELIKGYKHITIIAWSMGVWAASQTFGRYLSEEKEVEESIKNSYNVAYNGTPYPVNDDLGIPTETYHKMTKELSEATLSVFLRKMCGTAEAYR
jgi:biotin synthesis protein BioG